MARGCRRRGWGRALRRSARLLPARLQVRDFYREYFAQELRAGRLTVLCLPGCTQDHPHTYGQG